MLKIVLAYVVAAIFLAMAALYLSPPVHAAEPALQKVFDLTPRLNENCSGQLIYSDRDKESGKVTTYVLTAKHCVDGQMSKTDQVVEFPVYEKNRIVKWEKYIGRVKGKASSSDLAVIELRDQNTYFKDVVKIAPSEPEIGMGDTVLTVGYPKARTLTVVDGLFGSIETQDELEEGKEYFRASPTIIGGNSGGGLYHKNKSGEYELLGVTTGVYPNAFFMGYYTRSEDINDYLKVLIPSMYAEKKEETGAKPGVR